MFALSTLPLFRTPRDVPERPHALARAALIDGINERLEQLWQSGLAARPTLDPEALWAKALKRAPAEGEGGGRSAEDVTDFRERLERLCSSLIAEARLNPLGQTLAHGQIVRAIRHRLRLGALWQRSPHLLETPLAPPILVVGQMRSGTTRLHRLLAVDPAHAATRCCDSWNPVPDRFDWRPMRMVAALITARTINPWIDSIHGFGVTRPDEELGWLAAALHHSAYEAQWHVPSFVAFSEACDATPVYREFARILATDAAHHGNAARPRVMKVPHFTEDLTPLLAHYRDARLVLTHRHESDVLASAVSLVANQMAIQSDAVALDWIKAECRRKIGLREARLKRFLAGFQGRAADVDYADVEADWERSIAHAYRALDLPFTDAARDAMRAEQGRVPREHLARHAHTYRQFKQAEAAG